jgi:hypothetical protein
MLGAAGSPGQFPAPARVRVARAGPVHGLCRRGRGSVHRFPACCGAAGRAYGTGVSERSWYDVMRRRVAPIAFLLALVALSYQTCQAESVEVELTVRFGPDAGAVDSVRIDVVRDGSGDHVAFVERRFARGAPVELRQSVPLSEGMYRLDIELMIDGQGRRLSRVIDVAGEGGIRVDISGELNPR